MESVSIKLTKGINRELKLVMKKFHYSTKTEFIREAIRDKLFELEYGVTPGEMLKDPKRQLKASLKDIQKGRIQKWEP